MILLFPDLDTLGKAIAHMKPSIGNLQVVDKPISSYRVPRIETWWGVWVQFRIERNNACYRYSYGDSFEFEFQNTILKLDFNLVYTRPYTMFMNSGGIVFKMFMNSGGIGFGVLMNSSGIVFLGHWIALDHL